MKNRYLGCGLAGFILLLILLGCGTEAETEVASSPAYNLVLKSSSPGNIFPSLTKDIYFEVPDPGNAVTGTASVTDERGRVVQETQLTPGMPLVSIPLPSKGFYTVKASIGYKDGSSSIHSTTAALTGGPLADSERMGSRLGLWHINGDLKIAGLAGSGWTRRMWSLKDYKKGADGAAIPLIYNQTSLDKGFNWIGTLAWGLPQWVTGVELKKGELYPPSDWNGFALLVERFAKDLPEFPPFFEVYNEPDVGWKGTDEELVRFVTVIAESIKAVYPETVVMGPTLYEINVNRIQKLAALGLFNSLNAISVHAYVNGTPPEAEFIERVKSLKAYLASIGKPDFPIYVTEFGWTTAAGTWQKPVDELTQAEYMTRGMTLLSAEDVSAAIYFCLLYKNAPNSGEGEFSVLRQDNTPKPAYAAYSNMARWLTGVEGNGWLRAGDGPVLALFRKGVDTIIAAWDTGAGSRLFIESAPLKAEDMMGRDIANAQSGFKLDGSPAFLRVNDLSLSGLKVLSPVILDRGAASAVPFTGFWGSDVFYVSAGGLKITDTAQAGKYVLIGITSDGWQALPLEVR